MKARQRAGSRDARSAAHCAASPSTPVEDRPCCAVAPRANREGECLVLEDTHCRRRRVDRGSPARPMSSSRLDGSTSASSSSENVETDDVRGGRLQQVDEAARAGASAIGLVGRPAQRGQQSGRVEDVTALASRPLAVDQADQVQRVEIAERRGGGVNQLHAGRPRCRAERLALRSGAQVGGQIGERPQQIVMRAVRVRQPVDDRQHACCARSRRGRAADRRGRRSEWRVEERPEAFELHAGRGGRRRAASARG